MHISPSRKTLFLIVVVAVIVFCKVYSGGTSIQGFRGPRKMDSQLLSEYISKNVQVEYEVLDNTVPVGFKARITLTNHGSDCISQGDWQVYFFHFHFVEPESIKKDGEVKMEDPGVVIRHINGPLFSLEPLPNFFPWEKESTRVIEYEGKGSHIARTDLMPNWYVTVKGAEPRIIQSTASENLSYVAPFTSPQQWKRNAMDKHHPYTPEERYERNLVNDDGRSTRQILPSPLELIPGAGSLTLDETWVIVAPPVLENEALLLANHTDLKVVHNKPKDKYVLMEVKPLDLKGVKVTEETYILDAQSKDQTVVIIGHGSTGVFYGVQSLLALLENKQINSVTIYDSPRFPYRGCMLDVSRNFFDKEVVKKIIDFMGSYKLNRLHLHLADDEGWRIEIPDLPELTEVGGRRGHDPSELKYLMPTLGSGPNPSGLGCGYYTQNDYRDILRHAASRHVTVIPEIDMPGHSNAAIKSMRARYHKYQDSDEEKAMKYLLHDLKDSSHYHSVQLFKQNVINPCIESSYKFVDKILETLISYHADIQPLKTFHLGGDEVPSDALEDSPACKEFLEKEGLKNMHQRKEYFVRRVIKLAAARGLHVQAWEDGYYGQDKNLFDRAGLGGLGSGGLIANAWISSWTSGKAHRAHEMANYDYKVVLTSATHLYFDHHQEPDPEERGLYWATRFTDLRKVFNFMPENFWANMDGCKREPDKCLPLKKPDNIIGMEAPLWSETVRTVEHLHGMIILRLLALAERAWHRAPWETMEDNKRTIHQRLDWALFVNHLGYKVLPKLEREGFAYYLPLPGAKKENGDWRVNTAIPNHVVQFSVDGGATWNDVSPETKLPESQPFKLATRSYDAKRRSRAIDVSPVSTA